MVSLNQDNPTITEKDVSGIFEYMEELSSYIQLLDRERMKSNKRLNEGWASENHPYWQGVRILKKVIQRTREGVDQKSDVGRAQLLIKELKASKADIIKSDPNLWAKIERSIRLDESGLMVDEDILITLNELKKRVESDGVIVVLNYLNSEQGKERFSRLQIAGETKLVNDVRNLLSDVKKMRYSLGQRIRVLDYYYGLINRIELNPSSLNELIKAIRNMVEYLEWSNPQDRLARVIREKKVLLQLMMYYIEIQYLEGLLFRVKEGSKEGGWEDFLAFYDQKHDLRNFNEHVRKIRDGFGDFNIANVLETEGRNTREYGDQPLKWVSLLDFLVDRLKSNEHISALVKVGHKSIVELIKEEKDRIEGVAKHQLTKQLSKIEEIITARTGRLQDVKLIVKSILRNIKNREKTLVKFLKAVLKEFKKREREISILFEENNLTLSNIPLLGIDKEYEVLRKSAGYRETSLQRLAQTLLRLKQSVIMVTRDRKNPYHFAPIYDAHRVGQYLFHLENVEGQYANSISSKINREIPINTRNGLVALLKIKESIENALFYLRLTGFNEEARAKVMSPIGRSPNKIARVGGGVNYG